MANLVTSKRIFIKGVFALFLLLILITPAVSLAQSSNLNITDYASGLLDQTAQTAKITDSPSSTQSIASLIGKIINIILGFVGIIFLVLIIYGGITWLTASGNEEKAKKAVNTLAQAATGLVIVAIAFLVTNYIILKLMGVAEFTPGE